MQQLMNDVDEQELAKHKLIDTLWAIAAKKTCLVDIGPAYLTPKSFINQIDSGELRRYEAH